MTPSLFDFTDTPLPSPAQAAISPAVSKAARILAGERKKQKAIAQVAEGANPDWMQEADRLVRRLAASGAEFTTDAVWDALRLSVSATPEPRALGAVMGRLARAGVIRATGDYRPSVRPECHRRPVAVWRGEAEC